MSKIVEQKFYIQRIAKTVAYKELARQAQSMTNKIKSFVRKTYGEVFDGEDNLPDEVKVVVKDVPDGKIGSYNYKTNVLIIGPQAFESNMVKWVILHELAHAAIGNTPDSDRHGEDFQKLATALGIPERHQD
jgi:Zn-dependent peptidase ImmA (M78 family)